MPELSKIFAFVLGGVPLLIVYFIPTIAAARRGVDGWKMVALLNAILGWSGIGWVLLLGWVMGRPDRSGR